jgi:hypothetical protein
VPPNFTFWRPTVVGDVGLDSEIRQPPILADGARLIGKRIGTGRVGQVILPDEGIGGEQRVRSDHLRVSGCDIERRDVLVLGLAECFGVERVRDVER